MTSLYDKVCADRRESGEHVGDSPAVPPAGQRLKSWQEFQAVHFLLFESWLNGDLKKMDATANKTLRCLLGLMAAYGIKPDQNYGDGSVTPAVDRS